MAVIEGKNPVIEALKSARHIDRIWLARNIKSDDAVSRILELAGERGIPVEYVDRETVESQSSVGVNQGVIAFAATRDYVSLDDLLKIPAEKNEPAFFIVLDGIEDPQNLGAILRTAEAAGAHGVVVRSRRAVGLTPAVFKASAGAAEYVPITMVANIAQTIEVLKKNNIWAVGIDAAGMLEYTKVNFKVPTAIVVGGEGKGLSELVKKRCDFLASIPMKGKISSLNASVAAALVMYEVVRQRSK